MQRYAIEITVRFNTPDEMLRDENPDMIWRISEIYVAMKLAAEKKLDELNKNRELYHDGSSLKMYHSHNNIEFGFETELHEVFEE
jgi:hypothetical protein